MLRIPTPEMKPIADFHWHIMKFNNNAMPSSIDLAHNVLLFGTVLSAKPSHVLELGIGTGYVSKTILCGLRFNGQGRLTCVDSVKDWSSEPPHFEELRGLGANVVISTEEEFTLAKTAGQFDFLVSDADHKNALKWLDKTLDMMVPGSPMFFHDTNHLPGLLAAEHELKKRGVLCYHFTKSTRKDERCYRGWLMAFKQ